LSCPIANMLSIRLTMIVLLSMSSILLEVTARPSEHNVYLLGNPVKQEDDSGAQELRGTLTVDGRQLEVRAITVVWY